MPYPNMTTLPIWITYCDRRDIDDRETIDSGPDDNCIIQVVVGKCRSVYQEEESFQNTRSVLFMGRNTSVTLIAEPEKPFQIMLLRYSRTLSEPNLDLNRLCMNVPLIDAFFYKKARFCTLVDREYIYVTMGEICYEWKGALPERDAAINFAMKGLFVKLARSFHAHNRSSGIAYLSKAKKYMAQSFQQTLTVHQIALHVGISRSYLEALFARYDRRGIVEYLHAIRCDRAAFLLSTTHFPVIDIALDCGFNNRQHFTRVFTKVYGMNPKSYRGFKALEFDDARAKTGKEPKGPV
jgi:AraC-like DNA-binding protein